MNLIPDKTIDIFYKRIKDRFGHQESIDRELERIKKVNGGNIPEKIKKLLENETD